MAYRLTAQTNKGIQTVAGGNNVQLNHRWTIKASRRHSSTATRWAVPAVSYRNI